MAVRPLNLTSVLNNFKSLASKSTKKHARISLTRKRIKISTSDHISAKGRNNYLQCKKKAD